MIDEFRRRHWDDPRSRAPRDEHDLTDSLPYPFAGLEHLFDGKDVLEVGPGRGRQYEYLYNRAHTYSVCDISPVALQEPIFYSAASRLLLTSYEDDFGVQFDVVHFWYVLHHIKADELASFFAFIARHTKDIAIFNTPQTGNAREWYRGDGIGTTWIDEGTVATATAPYFDIVRVEQQDRLSSGYLFEVKKR